MSDNIWYKKFSIGLNLMPNESDNKLLLRTYQQYLSSLYFSLPIGGKYYSRHRIQEEFQDENAEQRLYNVLTYAKKLNIRLEWALNTYNLSVSDLNYAINCMKLVGLVPDEIVCLKDYGERIRTAFPHCELKYSFNNTDYRNIPDFFDTVVVGKQYLRSQEMRHQLLKKGFRLVLLLNNGCSYACQGPCQSGKRCKSLIQSQLNHSNANELYALQSFFPNELNRLVETDRFSSHYRYKISNRPLGLTYTKNALDAYLGKLSVEEALSISLDNYSLFGAMASLLSLKNQFNFDSIVEIKKGLSV